MRLLMLGTGPFAVPTFRSVLESDHMVLALVTRPTPPAVGRQKRRPIRCGTWPSNAVCRS